MDAVDHRNKGPEAATKAREEFDGGAELALDMTNSATALAVAGVAKEKHKLAIVTGGGTSALTGAACNRYTYHYAYDTYALAHSTGRNIARAGGKKWYGIVPNYAFGTQMLADFTDAVKPRAASSSTPTRSRSARPTSRRTCSPPRTRSPTCSACSTPAPTRSTA